MTLLPVEPPGRGVPQVVAAALALVVSILAACGALLATTTTATTADALPVSSTPTSGSFALVTAVLAEIHVTPSAATTINNNTADLARASARPGGYRLAPRATPALRQAYVDEVASIADEVAGWRKAGADPEFIAREAWTNRRALGIQYKNLTPAEKLAEIHARNLQRYGDPLGPSIDWLRAQGKTWNQIIESATRTGGRDLGF